MRAHPPDKRVIGGVSIGVLDGELRLADTTQSGDGLNDSGAWGGVEGGAEVAKILVASSEVRVAEVGQTPDGRELAGKRGA